MLVLDMSDTARLQTEPSILRKSRGNSRRSLDTSPGRLFEYRGSDCASAIPPPAQLAVLRTESAVVSFFDRASSRLAGGSTGAVFSRFHDR